MIKYRVKEGCIDLFYGAASTDYINGCQKYGIPQEDIDEAVAEYGEGIYNELEEIGFTIEHEDGKYKCYYWQEDGKYFYQSQIFSEKLGIFVPQSKKRASKELYKMMREVATR